MFSQAYRRHRREFQHHLQAEPHSLREEAALALVFAAVSAAAAVLPRQALKAALRASTGPEAGAGDRARS